EAVADELIATARLVEEDRHPCAVSTRSRLPRMRRCRRKTGTGRPPRMWGPRARPRRGGWGRCLGLAGGGGGGVGVVRVAGGGGREGGGGGGGRGLCGEGAFDRGPVLRALPVAP